MRRNAELILDPPWFVNGGVKSVSETPVGTRKRSGNRRKTRSTVCISPWYGRGEYGQCTGNAFAWEFITTGGCRGIRVAIFRGLQLQKVGFMIFYGAQCWFRCTRNYYIKRNTHAAAVNRVCRCVLLLPCFRPLQFLEKLLQSFIADLVSVVSGFSNPLRCF